MHVKDTEHVFSPFEYFVNTKLRKPLYLEHTQGSQAFLITEVPLCRRYTAVWLEAVANTVYFRLRTLNPKSSRTPNNAAY